MSHGLDVAVVAVVAGSALLWSLVSARLERANITAPMAFVVLGLVTAHGPLALIDVHVDSAKVDSVKVDELGRAAAAGRVVRV